MREVAYVTFKRTVAVDDTQGLNGREIRERAVNMLNVGDVEFENIMMNIDDIVDVKIKTYYK